MKRETVSAIVITLLMASMLFSATNFVKGQMNTPDLAVYLSSFDPSIINGTYNHLPSGNSTVINATVTNIGTASANTTVTLQLLINNTVVLNATTPKLDFNGTFWAAYFWNPPDGDYNLTVYAPPVTNEINTANNNVTNWVRVCPNQPPTAIFNMTWSPLNPPQGPVENQNVTFNASNSYDPPSTPPDWSPIINYTWNFGDGSPSVNYSIPTTVHQYTHWGNYTVTLTLVNSENKPSLPASQNISVYARPIANFAYPSKRYYVNDTLSFNASMSYDPDNLTAPNRGIASYNWNFGDGNTTSCNSTATILHAYGTNGTYIVALNVTDFDGLVSDPVNLTVNIGSDYPVVLFTYSQPCYVGSDLTFNASMSYDPDNLTAPNRGIASYNWNFGDGTPTATVYNATILHAFGSPGDYNVNLTVTDSEGYANWTMAAVSVSYQVFLSVTDSVTAGSDIVHNPGDSFNVTITVTNVTALGNFNINLTFPPSLLNYITVYKGSFDTQYRGLVGTDIVNVVSNSSIGGANGTYTLAIVEFSVMNPGNNTLGISSYWLRNSDGGNITCTVNNGYFYTTTPVAAFTSSAGSTPGSINFDASYSYCPDNGTISYDWDFNDSTPHGTGVSPSHNYTSGGTFYVNLTVTDQKSGLEWSIVQPVLVELGPEVNVTQIVVDSMQFNSTSGYYETAGALPTNVTVTNYSANTLTFNVTVYFNSTTVEGNTQEVTVPANGSYVTLQFSSRIYNVTNGEYENIPKGLYIIIIDLWFENSTVTWHRVFPQNDIIVRVYLPGDINRDNVTDIFDAVILAGAFNSKPGDKNWNPNADLNCDGSVDIFDAVILAGNLNQSDP